MTVTFDDETRALLDAPNFAVAATLNPDGGPQSSVVWILREGDTVLFSSTTDRRKTRNLAADPRISLTVLDGGNPYHTVEIRGTAELTDDPDKTLPRRLSAKYLGKEAIPEPDEVRRVIVRIRPDRVNRFKA
ncbi:MAG TPA: PPOX class F420-dependent oxidoreductase [Thermomonospora sp.]|nr:PPOX class F420-dependent oxidoreductase [Thermomonospora sp.]